MKKYQSATQLIAFVLFFEAFVLYGIALNQGDISYFLSVFVSSSSVIGHKILLTLLILCLSAFLLQVISFILWKTNTNANKNEKTIQYFGLVLAALLLTVSSVSYAFTKNSNDPMKQYGKSFVVYNVVYEDNQHAYELEADAYEISNFGVFSLQCKNLKSALGKISPSVLSFDGATGHNKTAIPTKYYRTDTESLKKILLIKDKTLQTYLVEGNNNYSYEISISKDGSVYLTKYFFNADNAEDSFVYWIAEVQYC